MLGTMLVQYLSKYFQVVATVRNKEYTPPDGVEKRYLDAIKGGEKELAQALKGCQWVINAIGSIPQRVSNYPEMVLTNAFFPMRLQLVSEKTGCQIIQIATDCVYSGQKGYYTESDVLDPLDTYGMSKKQGEVIATNICHIRCSIIGLGFNDVHSLLGWFLSRPYRAIINGYTNHMWNGVTTLHFAKVCRGIILNTTPLPRMQHLVPADKVSKYELLVLFAREFGREDIAIKPMGTPDSIDRTLATTEPAINLELWLMAGYTQPPMITEMVKELRLYTGRPRETADRTIATGVATIVNEGF